MKKIIVFIVIVSFFVNGFAQSYGRVGGSYSIVSVNRMMRLGETYPSDYGIRGTGTMSLGLEYQYPLNSWLGVETGLNFSYHNFTKTVSNTTTGELLRTKNDVNLINVPVGFNINFLQYGFIQSGVLLDLLYQPGFGSYMGCGVHFQSEYGLGVFVNPYIKAHSLLPFNFDFNTDRIIDTGIKIGVTYSVDYFLQNRR
ncbi:MAG: hypothetical protein ACK5L7_05020 [Paludibacteraceae bacterium]